MRFRRGHSCRQCSVMLARRDWSLQRSLTMCHPSIEGEPADVAAIANACWLATSSVPKLFLKAEPGGIVGHGAVLDLARSFPAQTAVTVAGVHFVQEIRRTRSGGPSPGGWERWLTNPQPAGPVQHFAQPISRGTYCGRRHLTNGYRCAPIPRAALPSSGWPLADQAAARELRNHSSKPMRPRRASPNGTSERSSTRPPQYRASGSLTTSRGSPAAFR